MLFKVLFEVAVQGEPSGWEFSSLRLKDRSRGVPDATFAGKLAFRLQQTELAGTCDRFGASLHLELAKDVAIVPFHRVQGEEQLLTNLLIRESLRNELEDFHLAVAQRLDQGLGG